MNEEKCKMTKYFEFYDSDILTVFSGMLHIFNCSSLNNNNHEKKYLEYVLDLAEKIKNPYKYDAIELVTNSTRYSSIQDILDILKVFDMDPLAPNKYYKDKYSYFQSTINTIYPNEVMAKYILDSMKPGDVRLIINLDQHDVCEFGRRFLPEFYDYLLWSDKIILETKIDIIRSRIKLSPTQISSEYFSTDNLIYRHKDVIKAAATLARMDIKSYLLDLASKSGDGHTSVYAYRDMVSGYFGKRK